MRQANGEDAIAHDVASADGGARAPGDHSELDGDSLAPERVLTLVRGRFGRPYRYVRECASTQLLLLGSELPEGAVAVAEHQTAGRGRRGRSWLAPPGSSLLLSVLLRPPPERRAPELSLVAALAVAAAVEAASGVPALVKWPNDVLVAGRKVAGVLAELAEGAVVLGVGVNVRQEAEELPVDAPTPPGSLRMVAGIVPERAALLAAILSELERRYDLWRTGGLAPLAAEIEARDALRGRAVLVDGAHATARGILPDGRLEIETEGGERRVLASGEVRVVLREPTAGEGPVERAATDPDPRR